MIDFRYIVGNEPREFEPKVLDKIIERKRAWINSILFIAGVRHSSNFTLPVEIVSAILFFVPAIPAKQGQQYVIKAYSFFQRLEMKKMLIEQEQLSTGSNQITHHCILA